MSVAMEDFPRRHRITVDEYHRMADVGLLAPDARVELIDGEIIDMPPIGNRHMAVVDRLNRLLIQTVADRAIVRCGGSVQLGDISEPQPDFVLLAQREDFYASRRANAADTLLVIEVSDTSLRYDSGIKRSLYARHRVPEFWIFDVEGRELHINRTPAGSTYNEVRTIRQLDTVSISMLPDFAVDLSSLGGEVQSRGYFHC